MCATSPSSDFDFSILLRIEDVLGRGVVMLIQASHDFPLKIINDESKYSTKEYGFFFKTE